MSEPTPNDPHQLDKIDQAIRINELKDRVEELVGEGPAAGGAGSVPADVVEGFWKNVADFESAPETSPSEQLARAGVELPPPESLDDATLPAKLWELIHALAARNIFLENTNHLSDRELYTALVQKHLREATKDFSAPGWNQHVDVIGGGSPEDIATHLRYYADDEYRDYWARSWPNDVIPPKEKPPYDRDRHLPRPPQE